MGSSDKAAATVIMWLTYLAMIWFALGELGGWAILLAFVLMMPLMGGMAFMWTTGNKEAAIHIERAKQDNSEKRKRERLDSVLRDLSDDDLLRLRERLNDGSIDDDVLYDRIVGDDGELHYRKK